MDGKMLRCGESEGRYARAPRRYFSTATPAFAAQPVGAWREQGGEALDQALAGDLVGFAEGAAALDRGTPGGAVARGDCSPLGTGNPVSG